MSQFSLVNKLTSVCKKYVYVRFIEIQKNNNHFIIHKYESKYLPIEKPINDLINKRKWYTN